MATKKVVRQNWHEVDGDQTLALDWPIGPESTVWEIGGYEGRWAAQMVEKFDPYMHVFEPQVWAYDKLNNRFFGNPKVHIYNVGLWTYDTNLRLWEHETDGASIIREGGRTSEFCKFQDVFGHIQKNVDVCLMNVEGGEYSLLAYMLGLGLMENFRFFWCQFHPGLDRFGEEKYQRIALGMKKTHKVIWDCYPTAVAWERK